MDGKARVVFVLFYFLIGPAAGAFSFLLYKGIFGTVIVLTFASVLYMLLFMFSVYRKSRDRIRVMANLLTILEVYCCYLYVQFRP